MLLSFPSSEDTKTWVPDFTNANTTRWSQMSKQQSGSLLQWKKKPRKPRLNRNTLRANAISFLRTDLPTTNSLMWNISNLQEVTKAAIKVIKEHGAINLRHLKWYKKAQSRPLHLKNFLSPRLHILQHGYAVNLQTISYQSNNSPANDSIST